MMPTHENLEFSIFQIASNRLRIVFLLGGGIHNVEFPAVEQLRTRPKIEGYKCGQR